MTEQQKLLKNAKQRAKYHERRKDPAFVEYHRKRTREYNRTPKGREIQNKAMRQWRSGMSIEEYKVWRSQMNEWSKESRERLLKDPKRKRVKQDKNNHYCKNKRRTDIRFRMAEVLRSRLKSAIFKGSKFVSAVDLCGCTIDELIAYLQSKFINGMSWGNYGNGQDKWNIDHIKPLASFDLSDQEQQKLAFHYTNLQPMWYLENCSKNSVVDGKKQYYSRA